MIGCVLYVLFCMYTHKNMHKHTNNTHNTRIHKHTDKIERSEGISPRSSLCLKSLYELMNRLVVVNEETWRTEIDKDVKQEMLQKEFIRSWITKTLDKKELFDIQSNLMIKLCKEHESSVNKTIIGVTKSQTKAFEIHESVPCFYSLIKVCAADSEFLNRNYKRIFKIIEDASEYYRATQFMLQLLFTTAIENPTVLSFFLFFLFFVCVLFAEK